MPDTDFTPLNFKIEAAFKTYIDSIRASMSMTGLQVLVAHQDTAALEVPRIVIECTRLDPHAPDLPGVMSADVMVKYISQADTTAAATHKTNAGTVASWLHDISTVRTALNTSNAIKVYWYEFIGIAFDADDDTGKLTTSIGFKLIAQGKSIA